MEKEDRKSIHGLRLCPPQACNAAGDSSGTEPVGSSVSQGKAQMDEMVASLLALLLSSIGTIFLAMVAVTIYAVCCSGSISLGDGIPGAFDDSEAFLEEESHAMEIMNERSRQSYLMARRYVEHNPPNSADTDISLSQFMTIQEKAVAAWEFTFDAIQQRSVLVQNRTEIEFRGDEMCSVQTNLPLPKIKEVVYWEAKLYEVSPGTVISIGLTTKPYPLFRLPGMHRYSISYESTGIRRLNQPFAGVRYGKPMQQGDTIGVGYRVRSGTVFFTHNGKKLEEAVHGMRLNLFPTIGATGPCQVHCNLGQAGFVFIQAIVKEWGLAPAHGTLAPPPPYGELGDSVLLEATARRRQASAEGVPAPPYVRSLSRDDASAPRPGPSGDVEESVIEPSVETSDENMEADSTLATATDQDETGPATGDNSAASSEQDRTPTSDPGTEPEN